VSRSPSLFLLAFVFITSSLQAALAPPSPKEKWLKVSSGEFRIFSNAAARDTRRIATDLVTMREALGIATRLKVRGSVPVNVIVFRDERGFGPYRDAMMQRKNAPVAGLFFGGEEAKFVLLNADTPSADRLVYHELTHYFVRNTATSIPLWLHEGLAEYYSTFDSRKDEVHLGRHVPEHVHWLREKPLIPLGQLFAVDARSPEYSEESRQGTFYAQSWALVHFLLVADNGARRRSLGNFLDLLSSGRPTDEAFGAAFQMTYEEMEKALANYVRRPTMQFMSYKTGQITVPQIGEVQPASRAEVLTALGALLATTESTIADAELFLQEAGRADPRFSAAYAELGNANMRKGDRTAAMAAYEKALELGSADPAVHVAYGAALLDGQSASEANLQRARELFATAARLDPSSARALAGLGATYVGADDDAAAGIAALEKSLSLAPSQEDVAVNLVQLYAAAGRREDAQRIVDMVLSKSSDPNIAAYAAEAVLRVDIDTAGRLMESGKAAEALVLLEQVRAATKSEPMQIQLDSMIQHARLTAQVDRVNAAIDLANQGRLTDAIKILDEVIPQMTDSEFKGKAEELRTAFKKRRRR
jgi:tetratricopeptide (TPR) repeat protein